MITGYLHHGVTVRGLEAAVEWYTSALGLVVVHRQRQDNAYTRSLVGVPDAVLEIAELALPDAPADALTIELIQYVAGAVEAGPTPVNQPGVAHLGFLVDDIDAAYERALAAGANFANPPVEITAGINQGGRACYLRDPDGNTLELLQPAPA